MAPEGLQDFFFYIVEFINFTIIPLLFALALLFFMFNVVRFFILGSNDQEKREQARQLAIYGLAAFVLLVSIWGIVNVITRSLDLDYQSSFCPDYMGNWCGDPGQSFNDGSSVNPFSTFNQEQERTTWSQTQETESVYPITIYSTGEPMTIERSGNLYRFLVCQSDNGLRSTGVELNPRLFDGRSSITARCTGGNIQIEP